MTKKPTPLWHLYEEKFLAFLGLRDVGWDERILSQSQPDAKHERVGRTMKVSKLGLHH